MSGTGLPPTVEEVIRLLKLLIKIGFGRSAPRSLPDESWLCAAYGDFIILITS